jgi:hypothetical protein
LAGLPPAERAAFERRHRPTQVMLPIGAAVRDQKPMPPAALARCLHGMVPGDWYQLLNARVFFWPDLDRLNRHRGASRERGQLVLTLDAGRLLGAHGDRAEVAPINTGSALRRPARRGRATFVPYAAWQTSGWDSEAAALGTRPRARSHPPAELVVPDAVPDVLDFVSDVRHLAPGEPFTV